MDDGRRQRGCLRDGNHGRRSQRILAWFTKSYKDSGRTLQRSILTMRFTKSPSGLFIALLVVALSSKCVAESGNARGSALFPEPRVASVPSRTRLQNLSALELRQVAKKHAISLRGGASDVPSSKAIQGVIAMAFIEAGVKRALSAAEISFPSMLGGCIVLFVVSILAQLISPGSGDSIYEFLLPGANLLAKWLPAMFVPGLAMLPLAPSIGAPVEVNHFYYVYEVWRNVHAEESYIPWL